LNSNIPLFNEVKGRLATPTQTSEAAPRGIATRDHEAIRRWGARHRAEPATGEATVSGPATLHVRDGGAGIRLNFPGAGRFRPITWDEWFENFERHHLTFVYEEEIADRAYAVWEARGGGHGQDRDDWLEAERQMLASGARPMSWYHLMNVETISARPS
jgi:hypothetical protein